MQQSGMAVQKPALRRRSGTGDKRPPLRVDDHSDRHSAWTALERRQLPTLVAGLLDGSDGEIEAVLESNLYTRYGGLSHLNGLCAAHRGLGEHRRNGPWSKPSLEERGFSGTVGAHPSIHPPVAHGSPPIGLARLAEVGGRVRHAAAAYGRGGTGTARRETT